MAAEAEQSEAMARGRVDSGDGARASRVESGNGCGGRAEAGDGGGRLMVAKADRPYADGGGRGGEVDGGRGRSAICRYTLK